MLASGYQDFAVRAEGETPADAATFYYPGWTVRVDGREVPVAPVPVLGTMSFRIPDGVHRVTLALEQTPLRHQASAASVITVVVLALLAIASRRRFLTGHAVGLFGVVLLVTVYIACRPATDAPQAGTSSPTNSGSSDDVARARRLLVETMGTAAARGDQEAAHAAWVRLQ